QARRDFPAPRACTLPSKRARRCRGRYAREGGAPRAGCRRGGGPRYALRPARTPSTARKLRHTRPAAMRRKTLLQVHGLDQPDAEAGERRDERDPARGNELFLPSRRQGRVRKGRSEERRVGKESENLRAQTL